MKPTFASSLFACLVTFTSIANAATVPTRVQCPGIVLKCNPGQVIIPPNPDEHRFCYTCGVPGGDPQS
ncbi:uncharacterized protein LACBIDRAFT_298960 [Laccaria bicolor S238N-H82]|uniref:Predicted protein n=1 Tax=Laccaria bicolor (strain S238N-H82 / ATCC MYA-4686) TaxID=486041 RepID=B0DDP8_LACBS|nr:uncharacterized protein LACBIDRAFT_298960 [Laccaria bicolor S238N-H82]EDR07129.1 predicted protein [Laccaria bicolor S238N-H82]|eukprot:XP_001882060.1 predicted protein [Laccaria bicolor S238N-H82]